MDDEQAENNTASVSNTKSNITNREETNGGFRPPKISLGLKKDKEIN